MITSWAAAAEQLAEDAREPGFTAAALVASAWQARCLPDATRSLVQAAHALTSGDAVQRCWDREPPSQSMNDLLAQAEELEAACAARARYARDMAAACEAARDHAAGEYGAARERLAALARSGEDTAASRAQAAVLQRRLAELAQVTGDCDAALELITAVLERLDYAVNRFRQVPADVAGTYDVPLRHLADGGTLPWSGDFLTSANTR